MAAKPKPKAKTKIGVDNRIAKAKVDLKKAKSGGAAKTASKLLKPTKKWEYPEPGSPMGDPGKWVVINDKVADRKAMTSRIITDKQRTASRASMIETNIARKKKTGKK